MTQTSCYGCAHFVVTHDMARPYACKAFQFQSTRLPALDVRASSGHACQRRISRVIQTRKGGKP